MQWHKSDVCYNMQKKYSVKLTKSKKRFSSGASLNCTHAGDVAAEKWMGHNNLLSAMDTRWMQPYLQ